MTDVDDFVQEDGRRVLVACDELIAEVQRTRDALERGLAHLEEGEPVIDVLVRSEIGGRRQQLLDVLTEFERSRGSMRQMIVAACLDQGATVAGLARMFGVSRQLLSKVAKDARDELAARRTAAGAPAEDQTLSVRITP
jgi:hypothetical protein